MNERIKRVEDKERWGVARDVEYHSRLDASGELLKMHDKSAGLAPDFW